MSRFATELYPESFTPKSWEEKYNRNGKIL